MVIKYTRFSIARPSKIYPNWNFWFENKPSGNPDLMYTHAWVKKPHAANQAVPVVLQFGRFT
jgi:hypothetical protein